MFGILIHMNLWTISEIQAQPTNPEEKRTQFLREAEANRRTKIQALRLMKEPQLAEELRRESLEGKEPFNSMSYKELIRRKQQVSNTPFSSIFLTSTDRASFLALLGLREISPSQYSGLPASFRVAILVDALVNAKSFNAWGLPHIRWQEAAEALIDEGNAARPALLALLSSTPVGRRDAPVLGLKSYDDYTKYHYRVRDYAWALLSDINGERPTAIPKEVNIRDQLIRDLALRNGLPRNMMVAPPGP
jgi:hypothetical protein